jgi:hypothetical protein
MCPSTQAEMAHLIEVVLDKHKPGCVGKRCVDDRAPNECLYTLM